jgi:hypothetical protein
MQEIKIVRLKNGEDIISIVQQENEGVNLLEPMAIEFHSRGQNTGMVMSYWLPIQLTDANEVFMKNENIMCMMDPNKEFLDYYVKALKKLKDAEDSVESTSEDEITETLIAEEDLKSGVHVIH